MKIKACAKINLTLDVTGKREDGYHLLDTVMHTVSLSDEVELVRETAPGIRLKCSESYLPLDERNTAYRAARLFLTHCGLEGEGVSLSIEKHIPSRAGLGGGSADAAAVLRGMNLLFQTGLSQESLAQLGSEIGADVPFCVVGGAKRCEGIGEQLSDVPTLPPCAILICKPPVGMSTPRAYALIDQYPLTGRRFTPNMVEALKGGDLAEIAGVLGNRFDEVMKLPKVREIEKVMRSSGALGAMMSGSGSAVYGIFRSEKAAGKCRSLLMGKGEIFLASPCEQGEDPRAGR